MTHNPSNPNCDKNQYAGSDGVRCTCDIDSPDDVPAPSTVVRDRQWIAAMPTEQGAVVLTGRRALLHAELERTTRDLDAARKLLAPAEAAWRKAMDAYMEALVSG